MRLILVGTIRISISIKKLAGRKVEAQKKKAQFSGMVERGGNVIAKKVEDVSSNTLKKIIYENVKQDSTISTDEWKSYRGLDACYNHLIVNHSAKEYVNIMAHTNNIECFWSHLEKRGGWNISFCK